MTPWTGPRTRRLHEHLSRGPNRFDAGAAWQRSGIPAIHTLRRTAKSVTVFIAVLILACAVSYAFGYGQFMGAQRALECRRER